MCEYVINELNKPQEKRVSDNELDKHDYIFIPYQNIELISSSRLNDEWKKRGKIFYEMNYLCKEFGLDMDSLLEEMDENNQNK